MFSTKDEDALPPETNNTAPGAMKELMMMAGNVESIPAMSIASPCCRVVDRWKREDEKLHQANTGVENPTSQAGIATNKAKRMHTVFVESTKSGANATEEMTTPPKNSIHKCLATGTRRGCLDRTINWRIRVGTGVWRILEFGSEWICCPSAVGSAMMRCSSLGLRMNNKKTTKEQHAKVKKTLKLLFLRKLGSTILRKRTKVTFFQESWYGNKILYVW